MIARMVLPVDGSPTSAKAIKLAREVALQFNAAVIVLWVRPPYWVRGMGLENPVGAVPAEYIADDEPDFVRTTVEMLRHGGVRVSKYGLCP